MLCCEGFEKVIQIAMIKQNQVKASFVALRGPCIGSSVLEVHRVNVYIYIWTYTRIAYTTT